MLYYTEAWNLVYLKSIIDEDFEAWVHGPVIPYVYGNFKKFGYEAISLDYKNKSATQHNNELAETHKIAGETKVLIDTVFLKYGSMSSFELEMLSHSELPWIDARQGLSIIEPCSAVIPKDKMREYYSSLVNVPQ